MPNYDYLCPTCGPFTQTAPMSAYDKPRDCPGCGTSAPRTILRFPTLAGMDPARRTAFATNERSQHEPKSSRSHGAGCGCCNGAKGRSRTLHRPDGSKSFPAARPWMISH